MGVVLNIGVVLSFFLGILLFTKKDKVLTDTLLTIWLFTIGIHLTGYFLHHNGFWETHPHLIGTTAPLPLLYGPFLYLYVEYSIKKDDQLLTTDYLHFLPALIAYGYMMPFYFWYSTEEKMQVDKGLIDDYSVFAIILLISFILSGLSYSILSYRLLRKREKVVDENFSSHENIHLHWLRYTIIGIATLFVTVLLVTVLREVLAFQFSFNADILFYSIITCFVVYVGYSGIKQQDLFSNTSTSLDDLVKSESEYKKSSLKSEIAMIKHEELLTCMRAEKPYLNPKLTLTELANHLSISANHLSQIINQYEEVNFHDFVNKYRVEEFLQKAQSNTNFNLLVHAYDSGFNSKSSFNSVFKKFKSVTPSQYISQLKD